MKRNKGSLKGEEGFTLIEIIAVLIVLGILAAVAVPKFFTLAEESRQKALSGAAGEMKGRVNQYFALRLLQADTPGQIDYTAYTGITDLGADFSATIINGNSEISGVITMNDGSGANTNWSMVRPRY
ncbi:MAG: prepilin-type N-terminal cleavage/methylation domain-containing protein [Thermodesulfobacteriota bacterium]|nr:prepilin-type N-terminal cleavage/methylation domain-containing protein [Thermodesulfobacteriota bacterium]